MPSLGSKKWAAAGLVGTAFLWFASSVGANGNLALNKTVTLQGEFFTNGWGGGRTVAASTVVDGVFFPASTRWDQGAVWWDARDGVPRSIIIDLGGSFTIGSLIVQADDNDGYLVSSRAPGSDDWTLIWNVPAVGGWGMQTRPSPGDNSQRYFLSQPIVADALKIEGDARVGDRLFSVSEVQAFGASFGADTSVHPEEDHFPTGAPPYDFYAGQVGSALNKCGILDGTKDIFDVIPDPGQEGFDRRCEENAAGNIDTERCRQDCEAFQLPAARLARTTYAYWYLHGPTSSDLKKNGRQPDPYEAGAQQAMALIEQWRRYNDITIDHDLDGTFRSGPVIDGPTLYGDVEFRLDGTNPGWCLCDKGALGSNCPLPGKFKKDFPTDYTCQGINRRLLEGFLATVKANGFKPGIYTNSETWLRFLGQDYRAVEPFSLWITSCATRARAADQAESELPTVEQTTLGGMKSVLWQYQIAPDYDVSAQDPQAGFDARLNNERAYYCSCSAQGLWGKCTFNRPQGLYLEATPTSLHFAAPETRSVTLRNPTDEDIYVGRISIDPNNAPFSQTNDCPATLLAGERCTITVTFTPRRAPKDSGVLTVRPPIAPHLAVPLIGSIAVGTPVARRPPHGSSVRD